MLSGDVSFGGYTYKLIEKAFSHSDAQMNAYARRGNSMRLNGIDAVLLNREEVKKIIAD